MKKRKWVYCMQPAEFSMECDKCHGTNITWSEFEHLIWCYDCQIDTEGEKGIFEGPIPFFASELMGISFARYYIKSRTIKYPHLLNHKIVYKDTPPEGTLITFEARQKTSLN